MAKARKNDYKYLEYIQSIRIIFLASTVLIFIFTLIFASTRGFSQTNNQTTQSGNYASQECKITGCNNELCVGSYDQDTYSICIYSEKYECYKDAKCEIQDNGKCGWTQTNELKSCLDKSDNGN